MLQFTGSITFTVNIGNFLKLQSAFKGSRINISPSQIEEVACIIISFGQLLYKLDTFKGFVNEVRHPVKLT